MINETWGEVTPAEQKQLQDDARPCRICGMTANIDPVMHTHRYGHRPIFTDQDGTFLWSMSKWTWLPYSLGDKS